MVVTLSSNISKSDCGEASQMMIEDGVRRLAVGVEHCLRLCKYAKWLDSCLVLVGQRLRLKERMNLG